jgi:DNA topoisomerase-3
LPLVANVLYHLPPVTADPIPLAMGKSLIIAEKPSVANDIARAIGGFTRHDDYFERDDSVICSAIGHLLELVVPEEFEVKRGKWSFNHLPVIPPHFDLQPIARSEQRLKLLAKLIRRKDVDLLVNACDAGREGELIFRYIVQYCNAKQPIRRLWLQSMTPAAIREGFEALRSDKEMLPLADAAKCRSEADWLIGINGTRAMTAFNSKEGGFYKTTVGRVQTPTLVVLIEREEKIRAFRPRDYWEVHATFAAKAGEYNGRWSDPDFRKDDDAERRPERIWNRADAEAIVAACSGKQGTVTDEAKPSTQLSPLLFDLTSLQREANARFGFSARSTLGLAQALYERHKVLTYPRTDARALPEDYLPTVRSTLQLFGGSGTPDEPGRGKRKSAAKTESTPYATFASEILKSNWVRPNKRIFDNSKISDHFAIIPTLQLPKALSEPEQKLYDLVVRRFLAVFYPAAEYLQTTRITVVEDHQFKSEGKILQKPGWLAVYGREAQGEDAQLVAVQAGERPPVAAIESVGEQTRPPARYTEATLLSAMEGAGKLVEDEELRAAMDAKGLGTPATRAAIIEGLIAEEYVIRQGRELVPTPKAFSLLFALRHFGVTELTSPELTGDWEFKLRQMEHGKLPRTVFMEHITSVTQDLVARIKHGDIPDTAFATLTTACPKCGGVVQENYRKFQCQKCDFALWKVVSGREWAPEEVEELIRNRRIGPLTGFRSRQGRPFAASIRLNDEQRAEFDFGQGSGGEGGETKPDFSGQESLGACPKCSVAVYEHGSGYTCENAVGPERSCDFRVGRIILQQPIERTQLQKLLREGRTDLLPRFISKKGRPFKAYLVKSAGGSIGFEFQPRANKPAAANDSESTAPTARSRPRRRAS